MCSRQKNPGYSKCSAYVTGPYHICEEIVKINDVVFKSRPIKTEDAKIKPKIRSQQYKISGKSFNPTMLKQQTNHQQHQSKYQPILQSPHQ